MLSAIISYLNGLLADTGYFSEVKGLSVLIKKDGKTFPAYYCNGEYEPATEFDEERGLCYWRYRSELTDATIEASYQVNKVLRRTYPLRLVCAVMRDQLGNNDNAYAEDSLSLAIEKVIKDKEREVRTEARALAAQILWRGVITSAETMKNTELLEIEASIQARMLFMGIDVDIVIDYQGNCINDFCGIKAPSNLVATPDSNSIDLTWADNSDNETGFKVYRATNYTGPFSVIATKSAGSTSHSDTTATADIIYFYKVSAFNTDGESFSGIVASVIASGSGAFDILNDKPTGVEVVLANATAENNTIPAITFFTNIDGTDYEGLFYVPAEGDAAHFHVEAADGATAQIALSSGITDFANNIYGLRLANFVFKDLANSFPLSLKHRKIFTQTIKDSDDNVMAVAAQSIGGVGLDEITTVAPDVNVQAAIDGVTFYNQDIPAFGFAGLTLTFYP